MIAPRDKRAHPRIFVDNLYHPLLSYPGLHSDQLIAACDPDARRVIEAALSLRAWRVGAWAQATELVAEVQAAPWRTGPQHTLPPYCTELTREDLARALLAISPDIAIETWFRNQANNELYRAACATWQRRAAGPGPAAAVDVRWVLTMSPAWLRAAKPRPLCMNDLMAMAAFGTDLFALDEAYTAGLETMREAWSRILDNLSERGTGIVRIPSPVWIDVDGNLAKLDAALLNGPGAVLVGERNTGRLSLASMWHERLRAGDGPGSLTAWEVWAGKKLKAPAESGVFVMFGFGDEPVGVEAFNHAAGMSFGSALRKAIEHPDHMKLLVRATPDELAALCTEMPTAAQLTPIATLAHPQDALARWICMAPVLYASDGVAPSLEDLVGMRGAMPTAEWNAVTPDFRWTNEPREQAVVAPQVRIAIRRARRGGDVASVFEESLAVRDAFGDVDALMKLVGLEARVFGMFRHPDDPTSSHARRS